MTGRIRALLTVTAVLFFLWARPARGTDKGVLVADSLFFDFESDVVTARGNAVLTYGDTVIRGEELLLDVAQSTLRSRGQVVIEQEDRSYTARELHMDFRRDRGSLEDFSSHSRLENGEPLIFHGERAEIDGDLTIGYDAAFTGCDREAPHYHLTARKVEYYPEDRIIFRHLVYKEGEIPLFYLPVMVVSLRERESNFERPVIGYNENDGWYVKLVYRYFLTAGYNGLLMADWFQYGGFGQGVKNYFPVGENKSLYLDLYHFENYRTGGRDFQAGAGWWHEPASLYNYSLAGEYWRRSPLPGEEYYNEYRTQANVTGRHQVWPFNISLQAGKRRYLSSPEYYFTPRGELRWRPSPNHSVQYQGRLDYRERPAAAPFPYIQARYHYSLRTDHNLAGYRLQTEVSEAVDHSPTPLANWYALNNMPKISLTTPVYHLGLAGDYRINMDYLRLIKEPENRVGERAELHLQRIFHTLWEQGGFSFQVGSSLRRQDYWLDEGEFSRWAWSLDLRGTQKFTPRLFWENTFSWVESGGEAPVAYFSSLVANSSYYLPRANLRSRFYYSSPEFRWEIRGGYNLGGIVNPWHTVTAVANWEVNEDNRMDFSTSYNPNTREFGVVRFSFRYGAQPENTIRLDMVYDPQTATWSTLDVEARGKQDLLWNLKADYNVKYSFFGDGLERARAGLIYNWHCRELLLGYDAVRREYYMQMWFKAFPETGFGFGVGEAGFLWLPNTWES